MPKFLKTKQQIAMENSRILFLPARTNGIAAAIKEDHIRQELHELMEETGFPLLTQVLNQDEPYRYMALKVIKEDFASWKPTLKHIGNTTFIAMVERKVIYNKTKKIREEVQIPVQIEPDEVAEYLLEHAIILLLTGGHNVVDRFQRLNRPLVEVPSQTSKSKTK